MTLIKSISGIRGTVGGNPGDNLTPLDAVKFAAAYGQLLKGKFPGQKITVVLGRDARVSGEMVAHAVKSALTGMGIDIIDLGLSTTPSVEMAVTGLYAQGGIILTASHNPAQWNALKLLNESGEFISAAEGGQILETVQKEDFVFSDYLSLGRISHHEGGYITEHIDRIISMPVIDINKIRSAGFKVVVDAVNSTGGMAVPALLEKMGVAYNCLYCRPDGIFPHNPEPLEKNLKDIKQAVVQQGADMGIVVDPDADRLALIDENGRMFGEEYTLVAAADFVLRRQKGPVVSNLSSSRALKDLAARYGVPYYASAVGEVNVVKKMKEVRAVIGGEGNGGVIYPGLHYGRDSLVGIAFILNLAVETGMSLSALRKTYPAYFTAKEKIRLTPGMDIDRILDLFATLHSHAEINREDGVKVDYPGYWIHLRKSNTEPIIRVYTEARTPDQARQIAGETIREIQKMI
jgi:phosphomannomutase